MTALDKAAPDVCERLRFADFVLDISEHLLTDAGGREVPLRRSEFALLLAFLHAPGRVLSRDHLLDATSGRMPDRFDRSIDMLVSRLRRKVEPDPRSPRLILTIPGLGYKFTAKPLGDATAQASRDSVVVQSLENLNGSAAAPDKPSIAVLPFQNMGQGNFAEGMTEEIITALSRMRSFSVVSRHSASAYKGRSSDVREVGRELGARYVLEGSVRTAGERVRITGQLVDTTTGTHLWADRFDAPMADVFDVQDQITAGVIGAIEPKLRQAEIERARRKPAGNLQAYDLLQRSRFTYRQQTQDGLEESCRFLQHALELDPNYALALAWLPRTQYVVDCQHFRFPSVFEVDRYVRMAQRAVELGRDDPEVLVVASLVIALPGGDLTEAIALVDRAIALNPNSAEAWAMSGLLYAYMGEGEAALRKLDRSVQLSPITQWVNWQSHAFALAHFAAGRYEDALVWIERGLRSYPNHIVFLKRKAASLALLGRTDEARQVVRHLQALVPGITLSRLSNVGAILFKHSTRWPMVFDAQSEGLERAGLPE